jgi:hypothetical protein
LKTDILWREFFKSNHELTTKRGTDDFKKIQSAYKFIEKAIRDQVKDYSNKN